MAGIFGLGSTGSPTFGRPGGGRPTFGRPTLRPNFNPGLSGLGSLLMSKLGQQNRADIDSFLGEVTNMANERFGVTLDDPIMGRSMFRRQPQPISVMEPTDEPQYGGAIGYSAGGQVSKKEAREKVRQMGGIMASSEPLIQAVANYQLGGGVNSMTQPTNQIPVAIGGSRARDKSFQEKLLDAYNRMIQPKGVPGMVKTNNVATMAGSGVDNTTSAIDSRYADEFVQGDAAQLGKQIQTSAGLGVPPSVFEPKLATSAPSAVSGQGLEGLEDVFKSQALQAQKDAEARKVLEAETIPMREEEKQKAVEGGMPDPAQTGKTDEKVLEDALSGGRSSIDRQTLGVTADEGTEAKFKNTATKFADGEASLNDVKNQVVDTFKTGVGVRGGIKQFMDEFVSNAPEYKGLDRGLAIAKIGFAMAAGESPNAITNIAKALSDGADMFIQDNKERDAFKRQVDLAGLQYAVGEVSKIRQEGRALARERRQFEKFTFGPNGGTYRGRKYGPYEDVPVMVGDIQDNKMPQGLISSSTITALGAKSKGFTGLMKDLVKQKVLSEDGARKDQEAYAEATDTAIKAERGQAVVNKVLLTVLDPEKGITGLGPAIKAAYTQLRSAANLPTDISDLDEARTYMRQLLQDIVPVTLAAYQGANSISNRDIDLLITAFFGDNALEGGNFQFVFQTDKALTQRLQGAASRMRESQVAAFSRMKAIEDRVSAQFIQGTVDLDQSTGAITGTPATQLFGEDRRRLSQAGLGFPELPQVGSNIPFFRDEDGRIQIGKAKG